MRELVRSPGIDLVAAVNPINHNPCKQGVMDDLRGELESRHYRFGQSPPALSQLHGPNSTASGKVGQSSELKQTCAHAFHQEPLLRSPLDYFHAGRCSGLGLAEANGPANAALRYL